jgi:hypothetical protein
MRVPASSNAEKGSMLSPEDELLGASAPAEKLTKRASIMLRAMRILKISMIFSDLVLGRLLIFRFAIEPVS